MARGGEGLVMYGLSLGYEEEWDMWRRIQSNAVCGEWLSPPGNSGKSLGHMRFYTPDF